MEDLSGKQLGQYQLISPLGKGGMAVVYKAYQPSMERYVAIKILPRHLASEQDFVQRFKQEAKIIASLEHPHILSVHDYGEADGYSYLVMRYIEGGMTLTDLLKGQPLPLPQIRSIMKEIADALDYAHTRGVIHRDIKPSNVLIDQQGHILLSDFGLAKIMGTSAKLTNSGAFIGTPTYASPEQCLGLGDVDQRSDIYSLGVILYEMATGRPPFDAETPMAIVLMHVHDPLPTPRSINSTLPENVECIILKALAKDRESRYQTAGAMTGAMAEALEKLTVPGKKIQGADTLHAPEHTTQADVPVLQPALPTAQSRQIAVQGSKQIQTALIVGLIGLVCVGATFALSWSAIFMRERIISGNPIITLTEPIAVPTSNQTQPMANTERPAATAETSEQARAFVAPILDAIKKQPPDFADDFSNPSSGWGSGSNENGDQWGYEAGTLYISCTKGTYYGISPAQNPGQGYSDYVMEVDIQFVSGDWGQWGVTVMDVPVKAVQLQKTGSPRTYWLSFSPDGTYSLDWKSAPGYGSLARGRANAFTKENGVNHLTLVVRKLQIALMLNDEPLFLVYDEATKGGKLALSLSASNDPDSQNPLVVHFDNLKIWDISKLP